MTDDDFTFDPWGKGNAPEDTEPVLREVRLTPASAIKPRRVRWLWEGRIAHGTLSLLAGREGLGKSTLAYYLAAQVSLGRLEGEDHGHPRDVLIAASEDSWEHTIVPRLIAAYADLDRVYRVEVVTYDNMHLSLSLPRDFADVDAITTKLDVGLMVLDPLMSVIDAKLDTHKDRELRGALEPLASLADRSRMAIVGLIHHNKSGSTDALQLVMGSKAFTAVARSVHTCIPDPDDDTQERKLFATSKNNLGRLDLPVLGFTIGSAAVETEDDGTAWTGRLRWTGEVAGNMNEIMARTADPEDRTAAAEAAGWLTDWLTMHGGTDDSANIKKEGKKAGHSEMSLKRARTRIKAAWSSSGMPRRTYWSLPGTEAAGPSSNPAEPVHEPPSRVGPTASGTNLLGPTAKPGKQENDQLDQPFGQAGPTVQSDQSDQTLVPLGPTGPDQAKRENGSSRAHTRAQGETSSWSNWSVGPTGPSQSDQSDQSDQGPPRTPAREAAPPICPDCSWRVDSMGHEQHCLQRGAV